MRVCFSVGSYELISGVVIKYHTFKDISGSQRRDWHYRGFSTKAQYPEVFWDPPDTKGRVPTIVVLALV